MPGLDLRTIADVVSLAITVALFSFSAGVLVGAWLQRKKRVHQTN